MSRQNTSPLAPSWTPQPRPTPEINPGDIWGQITAIPTDEIGQNIANVRMPWGFWQGLIQELFRRLECTPPSEALRIPFANSVFARSAQYSLLRTAIRTYGENAIDTTRANHVLFVSRGQNWPHNRKGTVK